ncbi:hypothetical protein E9993_11040 [Labilibacter sediminis]|nr:hypothetical protein E9993_11040 [Labilibacter sediminis]
MRYFIFLFFILLSCRNSTEDIYYKKDVEIVNKKIAKNYSEIENQSQNKVIVRATSERLKYHFEKVYSIIHENNLRGIKPVLTSIDRFMVDSVFEGETFYKGIAKIRLKDWLIEDESYGSNSLEHLKWDLLNLELELSAFLLKKIYFGSIRLTDITPLIISEKPINYLGDTYVAKIYIAAYDRDIIPDIKIEYLNGEEITNPKLETDNGVSYFKTKALKVGENIFTGRFSLPNPSGTAMEIPFEKKFHITKK